VTEALEKSSDLASDFDWTAHYTYKRNRRKAICGQDLLGIDAPEGYPVCEECIRIAKEKGYKRG
jgi:hypothetical protein